MFLFNPSVKTPHNIVRKQVNMSINHLFHLNNIWINDIIIILSFGETVKVLTGSEISYIYIKLVNKI